MKIEDCYVGQTVGITVNGDKYISEGQKLKWTTLTVNILLYLK